MALEVLLVMYKNTGTLCKNGYTVDSQNENWRFYNHQFSCFYSGYPTEFPACIQLVENVNLSVPNSFTLRRP